VVQGNSSAFFRYTGEGKLEERVMESYCAYIDTVAFEAPTKEIGFNIVLLVAIIEVESNWNLRAVGDGGKAHGMFQFHQEAIDQVYKVTKYSWSNGLRVTELKKYPLRQLQLACEYLSYWYSYGGVDSMLRYWNYTEAWNQKIKSSYQKWYEAWQDFYGL
jgi:hypothetical protein